MRRFAMSAAMLVTAIAVAGCYEDATPVQYEPGVYKGAEDPLLDKLEGGDLHSKLEQRFQRTAPDR